MSDKDRIIEDYIKCRNSQKSIKMIERKFLVKDLDYVKSIAIRAENIIQGYIYKDKDKVVRVRCSYDDARRIRSYLLTIKGSSFKMNDSEINIPLYKTEARMLFGLCKDFQAKRRYRINSFLSVDEYEENSGSLIVAEAELESEKSGFKKRCWMGDEVTDNPLYYAINMKTYSI